MARRIADIAPLWREALLVRRAGLRHEDPEATEEELDERLAAYVQDMSIEPEDPHLRPDPEWLQRILRG